MPLTRVELERFTAFTHLDLEVSPGINVLIGANGTGKTHLLKVCYAACEASDGHGSPFSEKLVRVMRPSGDAPGRLVRRSGGNSSATVTVHWGDRKLAATFSRDDHPADNPESRRFSKPIRSVYIPAKEMLANAPGFSSLYAAREIHFEEIYKDILDRAYLSKLREPGQRRKQLLESLGNVIGGSINVKGEEFFLSDHSGDLEFMLLAEGMRKLGLLWRLIQNGAVGKLEESRAFSVGWDEQSILFWDEPETNMNPSLVGTLMNFLLELQRDGVQVFIATHSYVVLKELDLRSKDGDQVMFHSLHRKEGNNNEGVVCSTASSFQSIDPDLIAATFTDLYDRQVRRSLKEVG
ncbi:MAG TPA: AAA family ATPase [Synechococcus sp. UBA8638]|nr:AAA family ATPase [Synechococcus sp. UBA8638]